MLKDQLDKSIQAFKTRLSKIRTGRANASILDDIKVSYYGTDVPVNQVATISIPEARVITIDPWEKSMLDPIYRAIAKSALGFNPNNDGQVLRINLAPLTSDMRKDLAKKAKQELEECKISMRNIRKSANSDIKNLDISEDQKKGEEKKVQKVFDDYISQAEAVFEDKQKEILTQ